jgi:hypothetical protein
MLWVHNKGYLRALNTGEKRWDLPPLNFRMAILVKVLVHTFFDQLVGLLKLQQFKGRPGHITPYLHVACTGLRLQRGCWVVGTKKQRTAETQEKGRKKESNGA